jgi:hypothetical protein
MRIFEFVNEEMVDEAVSLTKYEEDLAQAIRTGIVNGVASLEKPFMNNENLQEIMNDDGLSDRYARQFMEREGASKIEKAITKQLKLTLDNILGKDAISKFRFGTMKNMGGYVQNSTMVINRAYLVSIVRTVMNRFSIYLYDNYEAGDRTKGMSFLFRMLKSNDREIVGILTHDLNQAIDKIVSIVVHEAVHLVQHKQQAHRPLGKTEYRSYLDKTKGEFYGHAMKAKQSKNKERYYDLYYASPQEIAAFAHQMALDVIKANELHKVERLQDIPHIEGEDIIGYINNRLNNRFAEPRNPQETQVRRRYIKLVYQEVHRYIEHLRELLDPSRGIKK